MKRKLLEIKETIEEELSSIVDEANINFKETKASYLLMGTYDDVSMKLRYNKIINELTLRISNGDLFTKNLLKNIIILKIGEEPLIEENTEDYSAYWDNIKLENNYTKKRKKQLF